jgi:ComF family protein
MSNPRIVTFYNGRAERCAACHADAPVASSPALAWYLRLARLARRQAQLLLPQRCALCVAPVADGLLCGACRAALPNLGPACPRCALPAPDGATCGGCLADPPPFAATLAAHAYAFPVDRLLQALKYQGRLALAEWAGAALAQRARQAVPEQTLRERALLLVPLPLAPARQRQRGFNQARLIAEAAARELALPQADALARPRASAPQAGLPWQERLHNVRGAFVACRRLDGLDVVLVDDVMTTGATLRAAADAARAAGARRVDCWVVARTLPPRPA